MDVEIIQVLGSATMPRRTVAVECPSIATVDSLPPGRYTLQYFALSPGGWNGYAEIELRDGVDQDIELSPTGAPSVTGKVSCECQDRPNLRRIGLSLHGDGAYSVSLSVDYDRTFH